jgi:hypothetical protein
MDAMGIFSFKEKPHGRTGNRNRYLMISSQKFWQLDHEAGRLQIVKIQIKWLENGQTIFWMINLLLFHMVLQPNAGYGPLIHDVFEITHTTRHSR